MTDGRVLWMMQSSGDVPADDGWLTPSERATVSGLLVAKRRQDWRLGRWTAKQAVAAYLASAGGGVLAAGEVEVRAATDGAPEAFMDGVPAPVTLSISHRDGRSLCAVTGADAPLGCDLETVEARHPGFVADFFTEAERAFVAEALPGQRDLLTTLIWSAKESALKALRAGLRMDTRSVAVTPGGGAGHSEWRPLRVVVAGSGPRLEGWWRPDDGQVLTVVTGGPFPPDASPEGPSFDGAIGPVAGPAS